MDGALPREVSRKKEVRREGGLSPEEARQAAEREVWGFEELPF